MRYYLAIAALAVPQSALAASDCSEAIQEYNSAVSDIEYSIKRYTRCLNGSQGQDDCSSEFRRLKNAQSDLEYAVSDYSDYCE